MNRTYRIIRSAALQTFVVAPELAKGRFRSGGAMPGHQSLSGEDSGGARFFSGNKRSALPLAVAQVLGLSLAYAAPGVNELPSGGRITQGSGSIEQQGNTLNVMQGSDRMVGQWNTFNVGQNATVNFHQPNAGSAALNRINDQNPSQIQGHLHANGQVYLLNPNGVVFGKDAQVDVGGMVVSTQQLSDEDFAKGKAVFSANAGTNSGMVENQGQITAHGGVIAFIAPVVKNSGAMVDNGGTVVMAAGEQVTLDFQGDGLVSVKVDKAAMNALAENKGLIQADAGTVVMTARSANALLDTVVNNDGLIQAQSLQNHGGRIVLDGGDTGVTRAAGTVDASSPDGKGGVIQVTGDKVLVDSNAGLTASGKTGGGQVLIGGSYQNSDPAVHQASAAYVASSAKIAANALDNGDGGTVAVWSDVKNPQSATRVYGDLQARGGANGGNGGRIETSGHYVDIAGIKANASAAKGRAGTWLLDPFDLTVTTSPTTAPGSPNFASGLGATNVLNTDIETQLNSGTNVTLQTTGFAGDGNGAGDITINAGIAKTAGGDASLMFMANNDVILANGNAITSSAGRLFLTLTSDSAGIGQGGIYIGTGVSGVAINTNNGDLILSGGGGFAVGDANTNYHGISINAGIAAGSGNVSINGMSNTSNGAGTGNGNGVSFNAGTLTSDGLVSITGSSTAGNNGWDAGAAWGGVYFASGAGLATNTGSVLINGTSNAPGGWSGGSGILINGGSLTSKGSGTLTLFGGKMAAAASGWGIGLINGGVIRSTGVNGGGINLNGGGVDWGVVIANAASAITANGGNIDITSGPSGIDFLAGSINAGSGNTTLTGDHMAFAAGNGASIAGTGTLTIQPFTAGTGIGLAGGGGMLDLAAFSGDSLPAIQPGFSQVIIGNASSGNITVGNNNQTAFHNNLTLNTGAGITFNGNFADSGYNLVLNAGAGSTVSGAGNIAANTLQLNGSGANFNLNTAPGNAVNNLLVQNANNVGFINSTALNVAGVNAAGTVDIETQTGNLTISGNIGTTDASAKALVLNAGRAAAAGNPFGGDIVLMGLPSISIGAGGLALLYSGSISGSTGLDSLAGAGNIRYGSSQGFFSFTTPLTAGIYAIYREQPLGTSVVPNIIAVVSQISSGANGGGSVVTLGSFNGTGSATITMMNNGTLLVDNTGGTGSGAQNNPPAANAPAQPSTPGVSPAPAATPVPAPPSPPVNPRPHHAVAASSPANNAKPGTAAGTPTPPSSGVDNTAAATSLPPGSGTDSNAPQSPVSVGKANVVNELSNANAGGNGLDVIKTALVESAVGKGLPRLVAEIAGDSFNKVLVQNIANGVPMADAVKLSQNAFNAVIGLPQPASPQAIATSLLSSAGAGHSSGLSALSQAGSPSGSAAFEKALGSHLSRGESPEQAVKSAQDAARLADAAHAAGNSQLGNLAQGEMKAGGLANTSPDFQKSLGNALAAGLPMELAMKQASAAAELADAARKADAHNPGSALSSGKADFLNNLPANGDFGKVLGLALTRNMSAEQAIKSAWLAYAEQKRGSELDAKNPLAGFSNGHPPLPENGKNYDKAIANAIAHGVPPAAAIGMASRSVANMPPDVRTPATALADGKNFDAMLNSAGHSRTFDNILGIALARGVPVDKALDIAKRAESAVTAKMAEQP